MVKLFYSMEEGDTVGEVLVALVVSVVGGLIANYISKKFF